MGGERKEIQAKDARYISGSDWRCVFSVADIDIPDTKQALLMLINITNEHICRCPVIDVRQGSRGETVIEADLTPLKSTVENCRTERWKTYLTVKDRNGTGTEETYILKDPAYEKQSAGKKKKKDLFKRRFEFVKEPTAAFDFQGRTVEIVPDSVSGGEWILCAGDMCLRYMYAVRCAGTAYRVANNKLTFNIICPKIDGIEWKGVVLTYRYRLENDRRDYYFPASKVTEGPDRIMTVTEANLEGLEFKPINWDVRMVFEENGEQFWCHVMSPEADEAKGEPAVNKNVLREVFSQQSIDIQDGLQLSIACTDIGNTTVIVQQYTPYSGLGFRLKERLALLIYRLTRRSLRKKNIFIIYEKFCSMAQDNGFYFFRYCMENDMEKVMGRRIFYVIDKKQNDYRKLEQYKDHVIQFMSLKHMVYVLAARLLISSDSKRHAYAWRATESVIRRRVIKEKKSVFLQHGVFGLKRSDEFRRGTGGGTNLFIASNEMEKGFIADDMGYKPDQIAVTGLARWDVLEDKSAGMNQKHILVMPTWRKWLEETTDEIFLESEYYLKYMELINSEELADYLECNDLWMDFYIHPKFSEQMKQFSASSDRVRLIPFGTEPLNELMMECKLLITDYSSVCWDVYYMGKPVIFYQFDLAKYNEAQGSYMNLEKDLFGDRTETQEELLALLKEAASDDFKLKPRYAEMREAMYAYIDHNNSKRTCEEIMKRGW